MAKVELSPATTTQNAEEPLSGVKTNSDRDRAAATRDAGAERHGPTYLDLLDEDPLRKPQRFKMKSAHLHPPQARC